MTDQKELWNGPVGKAYTDAFLLSPEEVDALWKPIIGRGRAEILAEFVQDIPRDARILEIGCNAGNMLNILASLGFTRLYGVDFQSYAVRLAHKGRPGLNIVEAEARDLPWKDRFFDLVFTSGCLIHIPPTDLENVLWEVYRVSRRWVMGYEYFACQTQEVPWLGGRRIGMKDGIPGALWRGNYRQMYEIIFKMKPLKTSLYAYLQDPAKQDEMFLLEKL